MKEIKTKESLEEKKNIGGKGHFRAFTSNYASMTSIPKYILKTLNRPYFKFKSK